MKNTRYIALCSIILIAFLLFQTGLIYEISGDPSPSSIALSKNKMEFSNSIVHEKDVFGVGWLSHFGNIENMWTFVDVVSFYHVFTSYSLINPSLVTLLHNTTQKLIPDGVIIQQDASLVPNLNISYIYLSEFIVQKEIVPWDPRNSLFFNISDIEILDSDGAFVNRIYSNGRSETYYRVPVFEHPD